MQFGVDKPSCTGVDVSSLLVSFYSDKRLYGGCWEEIHQPAYTFVLFERYRNDRPGKIFLMVQ